MMFSTTSLLVYTPPIDVTLPHPASVSPHPSPAQTRPSCRSTPLLSTQLHRRPDPHLPGSLSALRHLPPPLPDRLLCLPALRRSRLLFCAHRPTRLIPTRCRQDHQTAPQDRVDAGVLFLSKLRHLLAGVLAALTLTGQPTFIQLRLGSVILCYP